jgi:hypothetical protein
MGRWRASRPGFSKRQSALGLAHDRLSGAALSGGFQCSTCPRQRGGVRPLGGTIDPRAMRRAHEALAQDAGAEVVATHATGRDGGTVTLADGGSLSADHVVVATGGWASAAPLGMARPAMRVYQRTVLCRSVRGRGGAAGKDTPSLIWVPEGDPTDRYLLPPIRYPDGRLYIKIGGELTSPEAPTATRSMRGSRRSGGAEAGASCWPIWSSADARDADRTGHDGALRGDIHARRDTPISRGSTTGRRCSPGAMARPRNAPMSWGGWGLWRPSAAAWPPRVWARISRRSSTEGQKRKLTETTRSSHWPRDLRG